MSKYELEKSVEAQKLNPRTGIPLSGPSLTIPFGAILDNVQVSDDVVKFSYMGERYQVARATMGGGMRQLTPTKPAEPKPAAAKVAEPDKSDKIVFETLDVRAQMHTLSLYRAPIPGGWLVASHSGSVTFVPDPGHEWDGSSLK